MNGTGWAVILGVVGIIALMARAMAMGKKGVGPETKIQDQPEPAQTFKTVIDGEEVELESISDEELEKIALQTPEDPVEPAVEGADEEDWRDVLADANSVTRRRPGGSLVDLKSGSAILVKAGIPCRVGPSRESLLGMRTLQVHEADFDRAMEMLKSGGATG